MKRKLKKASYHGVAPLYDGEVAYVREGKSVFFCGTKRESTSTINAVENVVAAICSEERCRRDGLVFFDVQTHAGYDRPPGDFEIDLVEFREGEEPQWIPVAGSPNAAPRLQPKRAEVPTHIVEAFRPYIQGVAA